MLSIPEPVRFSFENHWVAGNLKNQVWSNVLDNPEILGKKQDMNHESLPPKIKQKFQEVPKSKGMTSKYLIKYFNNSTQSQPACYLTFSSNMSDLNPFPLPKALGTLGSLVPLTMLSLFSQKFKSQSTARSHILSSNFFRGGKTLCTKVYKVAELHFPVTSSPKLLDISPIPRTKLPQTGTTLLHLTGAPVSTI